jgi:hypothetical protein
MNRDIQTLADEVTRLAEVNKKLRTENTKLKKQISPGFIYANPAHDVMPPKQKPEIEPLTLRGEEE